MSRRRSFRRWAVLWAVLQFALPAAASYADALLERSGVVAAQIHVEANSTKDCPPVHSAECGLCQVLSRAGTPARALELPSIATVLVPALAVEVAHAATGADCLTPLPRAPPLG
jgi:hypothetical protein